MRQKSRSGGGTSSAQPLPMIQDLVVAARTLVHRAGYAISVILTLALGIGASTMMFSLLDAAVLRPLSFKEPDRLVTLLGVAGLERDVRGASFPEVRDWRSLNVTLEDVAIYDETSLNLRLGNEAVRVDAEMVSPAYFTLLGVEAASGRTFTPDEDKIPDAHPVVVISDRLWRDRFGRRADILSQPVFLNDRQFSIVGVMPEGFSGLSFDTDVWFPSMMISLTSSPTVVNDRGSRWLTAIARLKSGVTIERASDDMARVAALLEKSYPDTNRQRGVLVLGTQEAILGSTGDLLTALFGAVLLFLVMACANVASLQLARTIARRRELAVRIALGASRWRVFRSLLAETLMLSVIAGTFGALLSAWGLSAAVAIMPIGALPQYVSPSVDLRALLFAAVAAGAAGALIAVLPALSGTGNDVASAIKEGARSAAGGLGNLRKRSPQQLLVIGEIALAMTLLTGAALLVRSLDRQLSVRLGFDPSGVMISRVSLPGNRYEPAQRRIFVEQLTARLRTLPNVATAAVASDLPLTGVASASSLLTDASDTRVRYYRHFVTPGFFRTLGIEIPHGRDFTAQDTLEARPVAIVNEAGARRLWGSTSGALGRRIRLSTSTSPAVEIVGVVPNARFRDLTTDITAGGAEPDVFFPYAQRTDRDIAIAVRAASGRPVTLGALQQAVAELDAGLPLYAVRTLEDTVAQQTATSRFGSAVLTIFSAGALLLAAIGLYGLIAYVIGLSRREIAVRMALGADVRRIVLLIVRNGLALVGMGVAIGVIGALIAGRSLRSQLFETAAMDPAVYTAVAALLVSVTVIATLLPARGAARVNPQAALRAE